MILHGSGKCLIKDGKVQCRWDGKYLSLLPWKEFSNLSAGVEELVVCVRGET